MAKIFLLLFKKKSLFLISWLFKNINITALYYNLSSLSPDVNTMISIKIASFENN